MAISRRTFLKRSAASAAALGLGPLGRWLPGTNVSYAAGPSDAIVVFVQQFGGNDGINTVYPISGAQRTLYEQFRPTLQLPNTDLGVADYYGGQFDTSTVLSIGANADGSTYALNPTMQGFHQIYQDGKLAVVHGVHYPFPDHSHFRSMAIYSSGDPQGSGTAGWFGRYMNNTTPPFGPSDVPGVLVGGGQNPLFIPTNTSLFAFFNLYSLTYPAGNDFDQKKATFQQLYDESATTVNPASYPELRRIGETGANSIAHLEDYYKPDDGLDNAGKVEALLLDDSYTYYDPSNPLVYDSPLNDPKLDGMGLAQDLRHVAATIRSNVGARFFHVGIGGFDTHSNQEENYWHSSLLHEVSESVAAFFNDMQQSVSLPAGYNGYETGSLANKVVIVTFSEFGRTIHQNDLDPQKAGTDHATCSPMFVLGGAVQGGQYGTYPSLNGTLDDQNDLELTTDFRDFFGTILVRWLGFPEDDLVGTNLAVNIFPPTTTADSLGKNYPGFTPIGFLLP
ncbi:MAG: DUF1501 domain-containing protein [Deltaproteobacteria bacterium]|nr:DUF1501 domain-containing protein [Deltaproteobacteria bacterium]